MLQWVQAKSDFGHRDAESKQVSHICTNSLCCPNSSPDQAADRGPHEDAHTEPDFNAHEASHKCKYLTEKPESSTSHAMSRKHVYHLMDP